MFDNQNEKPAEDILAEVDPADNAAVPPSSDSAISDTEPVVANRPSKLLLGGIGLVLIALVLGGYFLFFRNKNTASAPSASPPVDNTPARPAAPATTPSTTPPVTPPPDATNSALLNANVNANTNVNTNASLVPPPTAPSTATVDTDGDGLSDATEAQLGTNPLLGDTDADDLIDGAEVNIYKTDPLKADTDGDGYSDGAEVKNGYNPNGPGKLLNLPTNAPPR